MKKKKYKTIQAESVQIIKGAPPPPTKDYAWLKPREKGPLRLAVEQLEIGDAVEVQHEGNPQRSAWKAAHGVTKATGRKFTVRKLDGGKYGIWRIA